MQIDEPSSAGDVTPLWRLAFRAGFLLAAAFAVGGMLRWLHWMWNPQWRGALSPQWWHGHEMVFGFAMPVVAGFLLTAVATWTGIAGTRGRRLQLLFGLWLLARLLLWLLPDLHWLAWLADTGFLLIMGIELTRRVWARRQWRNMLFPPVLLLLALFDLASHSAIDNPLFSQQLFYGAVWMISVFVVIIGGRVTPLFTGNRLGLRIAPLPPWFDYLAIGSAVLVGLLTASLPPGQDRTLLEVLYLITALVHLYRLSRWQGWKTGREPLLWSMHLSYLCIPLALIALALVGDDPVAEKNAVHLLAVGTIGGMIIAMMSRVSLGHTGRPLEVPGYIALAFALVLLAAVLRALLPLANPEWTLLSWRVSGILWVAAFAAFLWRYLPVLTRPRADGKPG